MWKSGHFLTVPRLSPAHVIVIDGVTVPLNFHLEQYEGPLDLLLDLIRKQQIDIKDIPIATITQQYLDYINKAREMDIDLGAEFVYMAATLIHIKSRLLLPPDPAASPEEQEDPRTELVNRLLEHHGLGNLTLGDLFRGHGCGAGRHDYFGNFLRP